MCGPLVDGKSTVQRWMSSGDMMMISMNLYLRRYDIFNTE